MMLIACRRCTTNHISYDSTKQSFLVYYNGKSFSYSVKRYGEFAEKLANMTLKDGVRYEDYYVDGEDGVTTFFIYTKAYGIKEVFVDKEDADKLHQTKISVAKDNHAYTYYASTKYGKLHRMIMGVNNSDEIVDHIDRNGLNNTKKNLRIVDTSINNRNANLRIDNKSGKRGILEDDCR